MNLNLSGRSVFLVFWDIFATYLALTLATFITDQAESIFTSTDVLFVFGVMAATNIIFFLAFHLYNNLWQYASVRELLLLVAASMLAACAGALIHYLSGVDYLGEERLPIRVYMAAWGFFLIFAGGARFSFRYIYQSKRTLERRPHVSERPRTLIIGAGETGSLTIKRMVGGDYSMQGLPVVAVDDDIKKAGQRIHGVRVAGKTSDILNMVLRYQIEQIVVAIPSATADERRRIYDTCIQTNCHLLTLPNVRNLRMDELDDVRLREVELTDLLSREEVVLNTRMVSGYLAGKCVLITGGGGSIGSELARQVCTVAPRQLVIFDIYENTTFELEQELKSAWTDVDIRVEIGSVRDDQRLTRLFRQYRPDVVFHAAAHKHVPLMETNPREAVLNNVFGTLNVARAADEHQANNFIFISTDKAVNPSSVMGATKRMGEMIIQYYASRSATCFTAVRFGNVLGSHGSVIPCFKRQIAAGGPVTITHKDITRFFMTIPESARLVVTAGGMAKGGEIFILNMGEPVKIDDLAKNLIRLSGLVPNKDIMIEYIGLRDGEKLYEELLMDDETTLPTEVPDIMISTGVAVSEKDVAQKLEQLRLCVSAANANDYSGDDIKACLAAQVATYKPEVLSGYKEANEAASSAPEALSGSEGVNEAASSAPEALSGSAEVNEIAQADLKVRDKNEASKTIC
ncbi:MAG: polysaccharide biosynthesis protein [Coriobacteriales bacterium]|jgi:FlaA1/EpsC-like NDP-sugar epimerase|nr:polysaccharide biosynthesis protein [Coriobacteriales bacterium]